MYTHICIYIYTYNSLSPPPSSIFSWISLRTCHRCPLSLVRFHSPPTPLPPPSPPPSYSDSSCTLTFTSTPSRQIPLVFRFSMSQPAPESPSTCPHAAGCRDHNGELEPARNLYICSNTKVLCIQSPELNIPYVLSKHERPAQNWSNSSAFSKPRTDIAEIRIFPFPEMRD